jgi:anti-sigma factor RsiW
MTCQQARALKHAYADGEVDVLRLIEMEEHLRDCPACFRACENVRTLKSAFKSDTLYFKAPAQLKKQVRATLRAADRNAAGRRTFSWAWLKLAIPVGATALATLALMMILQRPSADGHLVQEATSSHVRSLMAGHLTDVASSDQHTVKPWFAGKLDFSPRVIDLSERGFPLVGGRLDYLGDRPVAALVYQRHKHLINLFIWPAAGGRADGTEQITARQGYNLVRWTQAGMAHLAVSDVNARELLEFVHALQSVR